DPPGYLLEALLEPHPQVLESVQGALGVGGVAGVVARREAERVGLDPGHKQPAAPRLTLAPEESETDRRSLPTPGLPGPGYSSALRNLLGDLHRLLESWP